MSSKRAPCPVCNRGPRDRALSVTSDERGTVEFCFRCGYTHADNFERRPLAPARQSGPVDWSLMAERIWRRTRPLYGSLAAAYLQHRHCILPPGSGDLRYLPADGKYASTMVARITDAATGKALSLHFTPINPDLTRGERHLLKGHRKRGGVIRLWPDKAVTQALGIAEGIESALCAAHLFQPMWAAIDAGNLTTLPVLTGIDSLVIFADHDPVGIEAALQCGQRWQAAGRAVRIRRPKKPGYDPADVEAEANS